MMPEGRREETLARIARDVAVPLQVDRGWVYARDPQRRRGIAVVRRLRSADVTDVPANLIGWVTEAPDLPDFDPLFARALAGDPVESCTTP